MPSPLVLPILLACGSRVGTSPDLQDHDTPHGDSAPVEQVPGALSDDCPSLYAQTLLPSFRLEMSDGEWAGLQADFAAGVKQYHPTRFLYEAPGGEEVVIEDAAVRLRGNSGFSWMGEKMQFAISFNEYDPEGRLFGLRKLSLDATWYDPTVMRDRLAYLLLRSQGVPAPCANSALLTINGTYYGLYKNVEYVDQEFLTRNFGDGADQGGLWKYGTEISANEEQAHPGMITEFWRNPDVAWQEANTDLAGNVNEWAVEAMIPHNDGYWCCTHNFYLYEHPRKGITSIPWDLDFSFDATPFFADPYTWYRDNDSQPHFDAVVADPVWGPRFLDALRTATDHYDPETLSAEVDTWAEQIAGAFSEEPHTTFSQGEHDQAVVTLRNYLANRHAWVDAWLECQEGGADEDGDGYGACNDCDTHDPTIHPSAAESCNGRDDDCDGFVDTNAGCDTCEEHAFEDSRMLLCWESRTWAEALAECQANGGTLGFPRTTDDLYVVWIYTYWHVTYFRGIYDWWIGASDQAAEGTWVDSNGASVTPYASWSAGQPDGGRAQNCGSFSPNAMSWSDQDCESRLPSICRLP